MVIDVQFTCVREDGDAMFWNVELFCEHTVFPIGVAYVVTVEEVSQLNFFFVADEWRGRGYGRALWKAVQDRWPRITFTSPMNETAKRILTGKGVRKRRKARIPFSDQLKKAIEEAELSRYRIAKNSGVAESTISQFMAGKRSMSLANIDAILEVLDLEISPKERSS